MRTILQAAFVDDILSLVALTMLLQIGVAESTGQELSLWSVLKPLVFSVLFCVGGALMAMPIKRAEGDSLVKSVLLRWVGIYPEFIPPLMQWAGHRGHEHHHYAQDLQEEQDKILQEYGTKLEDAAGKILAAFRSTSSPSVATTTSAETDGSDPSDVPLTPRSAGVSQQKLREVHDFIGKDIEHAKMEFHRLAEERAEHEHHTTVMETDMEEAIIHGKADLFESFLNHTADLISDVSPVVSKVLKHMAQAHNIIHEVKEGDHRERWEQEVEEIVEEHMQTWCQVHKGGGGHGGEDHHLKEFKEETIFRTRVVLDLAMTEVKRAFVDIKQEAADSARREGRSLSSGNMATQVSRRRSRTTSAISLVDNNEDELLLTMPSTPKSSLMEQVLAAKAEDRKQAGLLNLKQAIDAASSELDVIQASGFIRADIWDDWFGEVLIDMAAVGTIPRHVITAVEELQYLQTHLFASKETDILGVNLGFTYQEDIPSQSVVEFGLEDELDGEDDPLTITRLKWRAEVEAEHDAEDRFILTMMFALLIAYGCVANEIGSHLLGAFIAGMSFCWMEPALMLWHSQVKRIANWLIRLFFGATVAFSIPINIMMDLDALWKGMILGAGPCCLTKIISGVTTGADKFVVGFAMVGRGEFAYLVAQTAQDTLLNPAPASFNDPTVHFIRSDGGYWCVDGVCTNATAVTETGRRQLAGDSSVDDASRWCKHCVNDVCDDSPVPGRKYWQAGQDCADHEADCDCEMMMPASAFSICVWALVMASVLAPTGFGVFLNRRMENEKKLKALNRSQSLQQLNGAKA